MNICSVEKMKQPNGLVSRPQEVHCPRMPAIGLRGVHTELLCHRHVVGRPGGRG